MKPFPVKPLVLPPIPTSFLVPDPVFSAPLAGQSTLNIVHAPQSPVRPPSMKKGYRCTKDLMLPEDFVPTAYSVICGRGRKSTDAIGNRRLAVIAIGFVERYSAAKKKKEKTLIVSEILKIMRSASPDPHHAFVREDHGRWFRVEDLHAREKIGVVLRDALHSKYRSSTKSKLARRKLERITKQEEAVMVDIIKQEVDLSPEKLMDGDQLVGIFA